MMRFLTHGRTFGALTLCLIWIAAFGVLQAAAESLTIDFEQLPDGSPTSQGMLRHQRVPGPLWRPIPGKAWRSSPAAPTRLLESRARRRIPGSGRFSP